MTTRIETRRGLALMSIVVFAAACGPSEDSGGDSTQPDPASQEEPNPRTLAEVADDRCANPGRVWAEGETDSPGYLGEGFNFIDNHGQNDGRPLVAFGDRANRAR